MVCFVFIRAILHSLLTNEKKRIKAKKHLDHVKHAIHKILTNAGPFFIIQAFEKEMKHSKTCMQEAMKMHAQQLQVLEEQHAIAQEEAEEEIDPQTNLPFEATKKGKQIIKKRKNNVIKLEIKIDKHLRLDIEGPWMDRIHHMKRKVR